MFLSLTNGLPGWLFAPEDDGGAEPVGGGGGDTPDAGGTVQDDGGQATPPAEDDAGETKAPEGDGDEQAQAAALEAENTQLREKIGKLTRDNGRMGKALERLGRQVAPPKADDKPTAEPPPKQPAPAPPGADALAEDGLPKSWERNADGDVNYANSGEYVSPRLAKGIYAAEQRSAALESRFGEYVQQQATQARDREMAAAYSDLADSIADATQAARAEEFPHVKGEQARLLDETLDMLAGTYLQQAQQGGKALDQDTITDALTSAMRTVKALGGIAAVRQLQTNQAHKDDYKGLQPDGVPGVKPPKSLHEMSPAERDAVADRAQRFAEKMRQR